MGGRRLGHRCRYRAGPGHLGHDRGPHPGRDASDLRPLAATGASNWRRRSITAATAGGLAFLGILLGVAGGYLASAGYFQSGRFGQSVFGNLSHVPLLNLLVIVVGLPVMAAVGGFVFSGRQPPLVSRQPIE